MPTAISPTLPRPAPAELGLGPWLLPSVQAYGIPVEDYEAVAEGLIGLPVDEAVEATGMLHHHFPCLASMNQDPDYHDTLMHVSGDYFRDAVKEVIRPHLTPTPYLRPTGRVEEPGAVQGE